jgi:hypothetical protein
MVGCLMRHNQYVRVRSRDIAGRNWLIETRPLILKVARRVFATAPRPYT